MPNFWGGGVVLKIENALELVTNELLRIGTEGKKKPFPPQGSFKTIVTGRITELFKFQKRPIEGWY